MTELPAMASRDSAPLSEQSQVDWQPEGNVDWLLPFIRGWRKLILFPALMGVLAVGVALALPKKYTTVFSFTPAKSDLSAGALAGIAGQFGISLPTVDASSSPDFYAQLLKTDQLLLAVLDHEYRDPSGADTTVSLQAMLKIRSSDVGKARAEALRVLREKVIRVGFDRQTSLVTVAVKTKWRSVSLEISQLVLLEVNRFNTEARQYQGRAEQAFLTSRLDTAAAELRHAENNLEAFLRSNRAYAGDPVLMAAFGRFERELALKQSVYSTLVQSLEAARLTAVRNTPSISVVEQPREALRFDRRRSASKLIIGGFLGLVLAVLVISLGSAWTQVQSQSPEVASALRHLGGELKARARIRPTRHSSGD